jgi:hypothetical protein
MSWKPIVVLSLAMMIVSASCARGTRIHWYSPDEIADEIAKQYSVERAEEWLTEEYGPDEARRWRKEYDEKHSDE